MVTSLDAKAGGPPLIALRTAAAQALQGHEAHLVTYAYESVNPPGADPSGNLAETVKTFPGGELVRLHEVRASGAIERLFARAARRELANLIPEFDFVHVNGIWAPMLWAAAGEARKAGVPYCVTVHGMLHPWSLEQSGLKKRFAMKLCVRRMLDAAAFLQLGNRDEGEYLKPLGFTSATEIIPNGIFPEIYDNLPAKTAFHADHPELDGKPYVLFLSRLHYKKGLDILADAFAAMAGRVPDVRLVVAGPDGGGRADFERRIREAGLSDRVHIVGSLFNEHKLKALAGAACFCLPSRQEGFSMAITEALASGLPCVVTEDCCYPEVGEAGAGFVVPLSAREVGEALVQVFTAGNASKMALNGKRLVRERFTWHVVARMTLAAYSKHRGELSLKISDARRAEERASVGA